MYDLIQYDSFEAYKKEISKYKVLTIEEEQYYARQWYDDKNIDAAQTLIKHNLRYVLQVAFGFKGYGLSLADIVQEGNIGLMMAVKKFNPYKNNKLISYAKLWIISYIQMYILKAWSIVNLSTKASHRAIFFNKQDNLEHIDKEEMEYINNIISYRDKSLDSPYISNKICDSDVDETYLDYLADTRENQEMMLIDIEETVNISKKINSALSTLNEREIDFVQSRLMYNEDQDKKTLKDLATKYSISTERARQIEENILKKMKKILSE